MTEPPEKFNPSECRVNATGNGKFFRKFSLSPTFWSIEIMCPGVLVDSWFWPNGFTAVPEARTGAQGMPHIKIPWRQRSQYGGRGIICSGVCTTNCIGFALSALFLCKETLRLMMFCFVLWQTWVLIQYPLLQRRIPVLGWCLYLLTSWRQQ